MSQIEEIHNNSELSIISAPWNASTLFDSTSHLMPPKIIDRFSKLSLTDKAFDDFLIQDFSFIKDDNTILKINNQAKETFLSRINDTDPNVITAQTKRLNKYINEYHSKLYDLAETEIKNDSLLGLVGGDSSSSYPIIKALLDYVPTCSLLAINAELNLEPSVNDSPYETASIMTTILAEHRDIKRLVHIGAKHYTQTELATIHNEKGRIKVLFQDDILTDLYQGKSWDSYCKKIINNTTDSVYISIHANSVQPHYNTATQTYSDPPFSYEHLEYLLKKFSNSNKKIIGFDCVGFEDTDLMLDIDRICKLLFTTAGAAWKTFQ